jgi:hypothetical protein
MKIQVIRERDAVLEVIKYELFSKVVFMKICVVYLMILAGKIPPAELEL